MRSSYAVLRERLIQETKANRKHSKANLFWCPIPTFDSVGCDATVFLSFLIDFQMKKFPEAENDDAGWFPCSLQDIWDGIHISSGRQARLLSSLESNRFIQRKRSGIPPTRKLWIDYDHFIREHEEECKQLDLKESVC